MNVMHEVYAKDILAGVRRSMIRDIDVRDYSAVIVSEMHRLLDACDIEKSGDGDERDDYTTQLVDKFVVFVACSKASVGGSMADYCASNALSGIRGYRLRLHDDEEANRILHEMRVEFHRTALYPSRMFGEVSRAGIPIGRH